MLGAQNQAVGENGGGSYNLLEGQSDLQAFYAERDIAVIEEMWNKQIFPQLLRLNEWKVKSEDMPKWVSGDIQDLSNDEVSKSGQRSAAVGLFPKNDPKFLNEYYKKLGYDYRFDERMSPEEVSKLTGDNISRSGDGMTYGMNGGIGNAVGSSGDATTSNNEAISKSTGIRMDSQGIYRLINGVKVYLDDNAIDSVVLSTFA